MSDKKKIPNPGSPESQEMGCTCAIIDNHYGQGFPYGPEGKTSFYINEACPIHGSEADWAYDEEEK